MIELKIRDARDEERRRILDLTISAYEEYASVIPAHWEGYRKAITSTLSDVKPAAQIIAELNGVPVGAVLLYPAGCSLNGSSVSLTFPEIRLLAVSPKERGRGVGGALMHECVGRARRSGAAGVTLHTSEFMRVGKAMYERMGFKRAPEMDFYPAADLTVMGYRLDLRNGPAPGPTVLPSKPPKT